MDFLCFQSGVSSVSKNWTFFCLYEPLLVICVVFVATVIQGHVPCVGVWQVQEMFFTGSKYFLAAFPARFPTSCVGQTCQWIQLNDIQMKLRPRRSPLSCSHCISFAPLRSQLRIIVFSMSDHGVQNRTSKTDCLSLSHPVFFQL